MYKIVRLEPEKGKWELISDEKSLTNLKAVDNNTYIFYTGEVPKNIEDQNQIISDVIEANPNKINRVTIGATFKDNINSELTSCPGSCFCVVETDGTRYCETCYCNGNGYCWCVNCSGSC